MNNKKVLKIVVVGTGLPSLNFIDEFLKKNKKIDVISPDFNYELDETNTSNKHLYKIFPLPTIKKKINKVKNYFVSNNLNVNKNCNILGSLEFGGLSNYWGLQIDKDVDDDLQHLSKKTSESIKNYFYKLITSSKFIGEFNLNSKQTYKNDYKIPEKFERLIKKKDKNYILNKSLLAYSTIKKKKKITLGEFNENKSKFVSSNFFNRNLKKKNIKFHNFYVEKIYNKNTNVILVCKNKNQTKEITAKKVVLGCGTLITTKLILDYLKINKEIKIKHHPRLLSAFLSRSKIDSKMNFTPSLLQIKNKKKKNTYLADIRPGNKVITNAIIDLYKFLFPFKFLINFFKSYLIFSNVLLDSRYSNLFMKINKNSVTEIYSKKKPTYIDLKKRNNKIFQFLLKNKIIFPFYKTSFPGIGAEYHYFGTVPMTSKSKTMSLNEKCQLKKNKNIYIIDGSVLDFKVNKYPLAVIIANARRVGANIN